MELSIDREKVIENLEKAKMIIEKWVPMFEQYNTPFGIDVAISLLKEQEAIEPTINEYGEAYCICGENVGIIPDNKDLPSICLKYCSECGRRMKWNEP